jgi:hypothetical protein
MYTVGQRGGKNMEKNADGRREYSKPSVQRLGAWQDLTKTPVKGSKKSGLPGLLMPESELDA